MIDRARAVALATALLLLAPSFPASAADQDFPLAETSPATGDTTLIPTPGYLQTIEDPFYGGLMTLVTGTPGTPMQDVPGRTWETRNQPGYPSYQSWNADGSILYLLFGGVFIDGHTLRPLPYPRPPGGTLPQWSPADPYVQIAASADWVREYDVRTGTVLSEVRLVGYTGAGTQIRTSPSNDGRLIGVKARRVDTSEWVCLGVDLESGRIVREISFDDWNFSLGGLEEDKARRCGVSPSGRYLFLNGHANGAYNDQGHFFDIATGDLVHKQRYNGGDRSFGGSECPGDHGDLGLDANGDDVFVGICHWTTVTQEWALAFKNVTVALRIRDGAVWAVGPGSSHTSCRNTARPGWCYGSTIYANSIIKANRLDGGRTEYYADAQDYDGSSYWKNAMGVPSPDGTKVAFTSTWNGTIDGDARTFVLDLSHLAGSSSGGGDEPTPAVADYVLKRAAVPPLVDGLLGEYTDANTAQVAASDSTALFRALWDDAALYVALEVTDWDIQAEITNRDGGVWTEDSIELFLDAENNGGDVMDAGDTQFIVNTLGTQKDHDALGSKWSASWDSAVSRVPEGYAVEMSIPWSVVGFTPTADDVIGLSFALNDKDADGTGHAQWGGYKANFRTPSQWKDAELSGTTASSPTTCPVY